MRADDLARIAQRDDLPELVDLVGDPRFGSDRFILLRAVGRLGDLDLLPLLDRLSEEPYLGEPARKAKAHIERRKSRRRGGPKRRPAG